MSTSRNAAIAALVAAIGLTTLVPSAMAHPSGDRPSGEHRMDFGKDRGGGRFALLDLSCGTDAADRLDQRLGTLSGRLELTDEQQALYEAFRASALAAQTSFADACAELRPAATSGDAVELDPVTRIETRLKLEEARVAALGSALPDLRAFYDSLTDEQKAGFVPQHSADQRGDRRPGFHGRHDRGPGDPSRNAPPPAAAPEAPAAQ